ncbi:hypothetical protein [Streptomyces palmae]|uniref:Integral membrane protein n=1 Tax=Streptomyces palmae TaxID=1701085 RepID=A0A4Z0G7U3_9ACTN|nr:hypothetical protein [Streptomyces palmae]TGA90115.1 hypothetical protein E4099_28925 [Streptomyces palmae]
MSDTPRPQDSAPGDGLIRIGVIVFVIGAVATMATVAPLLLGADPLPTAAYLVSMLMGVGFALAAAGVLRSIAVQRRQARSALAETSPDAATT